MIDYKNELIEQFNEIRGMINTLEKRKARYKGFEGGKILVTSCRGVPQYYFRKKCDKKREYIRSERKDVIRLLLQRDYDEKLLRELKSLMKRMEIFIKGYDIEIIDKIYMGLCRGRKEMISPIQLTEEMRIEEWYNKINGGKNSVEMAVAYKTIKGEAVRSKSEKIIADYLYSMKVPYVYEPEFVLKDKRHVFPDFALYSARKNKTIYWEHLGRVDDPDYAVKNFKKLIAYEKSGLVLGDTLLISTECAECPLDFETVKKKLEAVL